MGVGGVQGGNPNPYATGSGRAAGTDPSQANGNYDTGGVDPNTRPGEVATNTTEEIYSTGSGSAAGTGATPEAKSGGSSGSATKSNIDNSIAGLAPPGSAADNVQDLSDTTNEISKVTNESDKERIKADAERQKQVAEERKAKADEVAKQTDEARKQAESTKWWGVFKSVLNWVGSVVQIAAGVALIATGAGAAVGALMIAGGTAGLLNAIDSTVKLATGGTGLLGTLAKWGGASDETAAKWDMGFTITMGVVQAGTAIATFFVNPAQLANVTAQVATITNQVTGMGTAALTIAGDVYTAVTGYSTTGKKASAMDSQAQAQALEAAAKSIEAAVTAAAKNADKAAAAWVNILTSQQDLLKETGDANSGTRFMTA